MNYKAIEPIGDVTKLDLLVERTDGSVEMCIVAQAPLDGSEETLRIVEVKIRNYLREALDSSFRANYGGVSPEHIAILFESRFDVDPSVLSRLSRLAIEVGRQGPKLQFVKYAESD
jgi:hypothetical protein